MEIFGCNFVPSTQTNMFNVDFNINVDYEKLKANIKCQTLFLKAKTTIGDDGLIQDTLTDKDLEQVNKLII